MTLVHCMFCLGFRNETNVQTTIEHYENDVIVGAQSTASSQRLFRVDDLSKKSLERLPVPPYSRGDQHWPREAVGECRYEYRGWSTVAPRLSAFF